MKSPMKKHEKSGVLITFCGLDGCGKSTQISLLKSFLAEFDLSVTLTKQPTDFIRNAKMFRTFQDEETPEKNSYDYRAVSLLCASDRIQHSNRVILPLLEHGEIVISDRYFFSCLANLRARGYTKDKWIDEVAEFIPKPDYAFFLDVDVDTAAYRVRQRPEERERHIDMGMQQRLREQYLLIAKKYDGFILDSGKSPEETFADIQAILLKSPK